MEKFNNSSELIKFIESRRRISNKVDLSKMNQLLDIYNHPEKKLNVIHITGTNGKGSTVSFLNSIFRQANLNVGCFTSPYITCFNERIRYNDENISDDDLLTIGNEIVSKYDTLDNLGIEHPSFFEFVTLICFIYFSRIKNLDLVLLEVGIGGRLDSTNVVNPLISAITGVSLDHTEILGDSLEEILIEKMGIVKPNKPVFMNLPNNELMDIAEKYCSKINSNCNIIDKTNIEILYSGLSGSFFLYNKEKLEISLLGYHQIENAVLAYEIAKYYFENIRKDFSNYKVILSNGLKKASWAGRLEIVKEEPLIILDGAHNIDGVKRVCEFLNSIKVSSKIRGIVAVSDNKKKEEMIEILDKTFDELIFTKFNYSRSSSSNVLYNLSKSTNKLLLEDLEQIFLLINNDNEKTINIFIGSLYFVSEVRGFLKS